MMKRIATIVVLMCAIVCLTALLWLAMVAGATMSYAAAPPVKQAPTQRQTMKSRSHAPKAGVTATLRYERIADMTSTRTSHVMFPSGDGFVVVGGKDTNGDLVTTAEQYENGQWHTMKCNAPHNDGFIVPLANGRYMVGGCDAFLNEEGAARSTEIWNPTTGTFTAAAKMTVDRYGCNAISVPNGKVFVSGNCFGEDKKMDCWDGTSFKGVGDMDGRYRPYLFYSSAGYVVSMSYLNNELDMMDLYTYSDGSKGLLADRYYIATGETKYIATPYDEALIPSVLPCGMTPDDYHFTADGQNLYMVLAGVVDESVERGYRYVLLYYNADENQTYIFSDFQIPMKHPVSGEDIEYRGGVIVNESRHEAYLIGYSGDYENQTLHLVSFNYNTQEWTIASAAGFNHDMTDTAAWTLLADGRLACTGGSVWSKNVSKEAYIFTPPVAGQGNDDDDPAVAGNTLVVHTKDGAATTFLLSEKPMVMFEGKTLRVVSAKADVTYKLVDILRFTYIRNTQGIGDIDNGQTEVDYRDGELVISGMKAGATVGVYSLDGKLVSQLKASHAGTFRLSLSSLPKGAYIVKANNVSYKIMKR